MAERPKQKSPYAGKNGAPGWNRTSDTRFRKHVEGVTDGGPSCVIVQHGPRFWAGSVVGRAQACWAVMRRVVGNPAATSSWPRWGGRAPELEPHGRARLPAQKRKRGGVRGGSWTSLPPSTRSGRIMRWNTCRVAAGGSTVQAHLRCRQSQPDAGREDSSSGHAPSIDDRTRSIRAHDAA